MRDGLRRRLSRPAIAGLVAAVLAVAAFWPALGQGWVYDDNVLIVRNPSVARPTSASRILAGSYWPAGTSADKLYRPLTVASFRLNVAWGPSSGPDALAFHAVNLVLHAAGAALVVLLAVRITGSASAGWAAGLLFAAHPVLAEAVATAYGRSDLLAGVCALALLLAECARPPGRRSAADHALVGVLFASAVLAKESALFLWPAALAVQIQHHRRSAAGAAPAWKRWIEETLPAAQAPYAIVATLTLVLRWNALHALRLPDAALREWDDPLAAAPPLARVLTPLRLLWLTVGLLIDPRSTSPLWSAPALAPALSLSADVAAGGMVAAALTVTGVWLWRRRSLLAPFLLPGLFLSLAVPLHVPHLAHWLFAERWLYLPTALAAVLVGGAARGRPALAALALAVGLVLMPMARSYTRSYADDLTMAQEAVRRLPDGFQGRRNLMLALWTAGRRAEAEVAARYLDRRFGATPEAAFLLLRAALAAGDETAAQAALQRLVRLAPDLPPRWLDAQRRRVLELGAPHPTPPPPP